MQAYLTNFVLTHSVTGWKAYGLAVVLTLFTLAIRIALGPIINDGIQHELIAPTAILLALLTGWRAVCLATAITMVGEWVYLSSPDATLSERLMSEFVIATFMLVTSGVVFLLVDALKEVHRVNEKAEHARRELGHRVQNLFAVTQSLVRLSKRFYPDDPARVLADMTGRIDALARANAVLQSSRNVDEFSLRDFIDNLLSPYRPENTDRLHIEGPDVFVRARLITSLGLFFHELSTNAVKYGAFQNTDASMTLVWTLKTTPTSRRLSFTWTETLPQDTVFDTDASTGFGSVILKTSVSQLDAEFQRDLKPGGLVISLSFDID
ncbi:MAG: HWE histidine kinase domain-containing protein [Aliishimia sp.]